MSLRKLQSDAVLVIACISFVAMLVARPANAGTCTPDPTITGNAILNTYPNLPFSLQNNPTGYGDARPDTIGGNEMNQLLMANNSTNLYIAVTGNVRTDDVLQNTFLIFLDTDNLGGATILNTSGMSGSNALKNLDIDDMTDGATLDFGPEYCIAVWNDQNTFKCLLHNLSNPNNVGVSVTSIGGSFAFKNDNTDGVTDDVSFDPQTTNAATAVNGFEVRIPLSQLGPLANTATIRAFALLASGGGYMSNQGLPSISQPNGGAGNIGNHDPNATVPNIVDFSNETRFPGLQNASFTLSAGGAAPSGLFNGTNLVSRYTAVGLSLATQNNYTGFGNQLPFVPPTDGSELDQIFVKADFTKLYVGVTGNVPLFGNNLDTIMLFIDVPDGFDPGVNDLKGVANFTGGPGGLQLMSQGAAGAFTFDNNFSPEWCLMYWRQDSAHHGIVQDLRSDDHWDLLITNDPADHTGASSSCVIADLFNILGVNSIAGDDPIRQEGLANGTLPEPDAPPTSGAQFSILWNDIYPDFTGDPANIKLMACVVSGSGFISNQFLPPLQPTNPASHPTPEADTEAFNSGSLAIPDNTGSPAVDTKTAAMPAINRINDINVHVNILHNDISQLGVAIRHVASAREVQLLNSGSGAGTDLNVIYDSDGAIGTVLPAESLLTFNGVDPNGDWELVVTDSVTGVTGTLETWQIDVSQTYGGGVACLGNYDAATNNLDLSAEELGVRFEGDQFLDLAIAASGAPATFNGKQIPDAFGGLGNALSTQNNYTCFGDAVTGQLGTVPGSEIDQIRVENTADRLHVGVTGNLENNGNVYVLLLDTDGAGGGSQTLPVLSSPPPVMGGLDGLTLDAGFTPNYAVVVGRDPTVGVPNDAYNVFLKDINTNTTRTIGRLLRDSGSGVLDDAIPNQNGSELDTLFIQNDADNLYLGITGNLEGNGNTWVIFLQTTAAGSGSNIISSDQVNWPKTLRGMNSDRMDNDGMGSNFQPDFAIVMNRSGGFYFAQLVDLLDVAGGTLITNLTFDNTTYPPVGDTYAGDNNNAAGVNDNSADDTTAGTLGTVQYDNALTATRGVQFAISRATLVHSPDPGPSDGDTIKVGVILANNGGGGAVPSTYYSNQFLPPLAGGTLANLAEPPPPGRPTTFIDLSNETVAPGEQFYSYALATSGAYQVPLTFTGAGIPDAMGNTPVAVQENYTGFGNVILVNPGNANCMQVAFDNTNFDGVTGISATAPETAFTGMEFDLPFLDIGLTPLTQTVGPLGEIKMLVFLTSQGGSFSNQLMPPLNRDPPAGNLNSIPGNWSGDLSDDLIAPGDQYLCYQLLYDCGPKPTDVADAGVDGVPGDASVCAGQTVDLTATVAGGVTVDWYTGPCLETLVGSGTAVSISPAADTTYYARARNSTTGCLSANYDIVNVTVIGNADPIDIDNDGSHTNADVSALVGAILGYNTDPCQVFKSDVNGVDGATSHDIQTFVDLWMGS